MDFTSPTSASPSLVATQAAVNADPRLAPVAKGDKHIWGIYIFLVIISVIELYSASSREVNIAGMGVYGTIIRHGAMLLAGFGIIWFLQRTHYRVILRWVPIFALVSVAMMVYTIFFGTDINGARRSFNLLFVSIQPSEFIKISAAMMVALIMSRFQLKGGGVDSRAVAATAAIIMIFGGLLVPQGLTNTIMLMCISISMMIISGIGCRKLAVVLVVYGACFGLYLLVSHDDDHSRVGTWVERIEAYVGMGKPKYEEKITSDNRQEMLGYIAQAHGGITGVLPGNSRETSRLPLAFTDYIYSIVVEELGLWGGLFVLVLYLWLLGRASTIASRCSRAFPALLVIGMALVIVFQALFHICIVTGVIPVSGQPLPLISKGGSSIFVTSIAFGVMLSVSRFAVRTGGKKRDIKNEIEVLPEEVRADNPSQL
ncbi:MAG: FtsW/RodA/SpoVE family cell cycle protein [Firmicutes bacterium]|nr:FtsW/RodA/SpoVE family cell cycle protein [Bacillota bacterium]MCM1401076.1 FtsW/RodA/SpoVE family cell cycle protein [Bacteroides sp.]MCM1476995.1 FtsW/RodA/SpoVE family cell cycle protein [Bacteroides sp.]